MRASTLLCEFSSRGITFTPDGDLLRISAPTGVLTDADREALCQHKASILSLLVRVPTGGLAEGRHEHQIRDGAGSKSSLEFTVAD